MADVFISYHEKSAGELAEQIADALENAGISSWCARRDLPFGGNFAREIPAQIDACKVFLLFVTESADTWHIESELRLAFERLNRGEDITILPLEIGNFEQKPFIYYLINLQSVRIPQLDAPQIEQLTRKIAQILNREMSTEIIKRVECGDGVKYTLRNGVLTIFGNGPMWDFAWDGEMEAYDLPWQNERQKISIVKILNNVMTIGTGAFDNCSRLTSVTISNSVTSIGDCAFVDCMALTSINIPNSVTSIENSAFAGCAALRNVNIPNSVTSIEDFAFAGCATLRSINIPGSVTYIGNCAFRNCKKLISVNIPDSVTYIGNYAFKGCERLQYVYIPARTRLAYDAFPRYVRVKRKWFGFFWKH